MNDNPYLAPQSTSSAVGQSGAVGVLSGSREDLRRVAKAQKGILVCILLSILALGMTATIGEGSEAHTLLSFVVLVVGVIGAVFVFRLAMIVFGTGLGIVLGVLSLIPLIGLIVLLVVNGKATNVLKQNGIKVGLLGANVGSI